MEIEKLEKMVEALEKVFEYGFVPKVKFETEKWVKNKLFYFILIHGLYDEYVEFSKAYKSEDPHKDCVRWLLGKMPK